MTAQTQHWIVYAYQHANDKEFSMGYFDGTRAQATKHFRAKKNVKRYFRPGYTVTMRANPIILHDGYETNPKLRQKGNTKVTQGPANQLTVTLYSTDIVEILPTGDIRLNTGGHKTATTKRRMNEAADELELYFNVYAKKGQWYVDTVGRNAGNQTYEFFDGITIPGPGHLKNNPRHKRPAGKAPYKHKGYEIWNMGGRHWAYRKPRTDKYIGEFKTVAAAMTAIDKLKKGTRKKNPQSYYNIFKCKGNDVRWLKGFAIEKPRWTLTRGDAAQYRYEHEARAIAEWAFVRGWKVGAAEKGSRVADIIKACKRGKV